jgi:hypothetical protein
MFRRRPRGHIWPPLRPWAKPVRPAIPAMPAPAQQALVRANRLMENGDFANAAAIYEKMGRDAHDLGRPRQAAHLYLQATRAHFLAGQFPPGQSLARQGLSILAEQGMWEAFDRLGARTISELTAHNQPQAAEELSHWMDSQRQGQSTSSRLPSHLSVTLPLKCPCCGASIRSDEVEWIDDAHAECAYCGSTLGGG